MTRIDISPQERDALKKEIKQEIRHEDLRKKMIGCGSCALIVLVLLGVPATYVAAQFAKTGFYDVPVLAKMLYKPTTPTRVVQPLYGSKPEDVLKIVGTKIKYDAKTNLATLPVTEAELTTVVQNAVANAPADTLPFPVRTIQVALDKDEIEIFATSPQKNRDATVRVRFRPFVKGGELKVAVTEIAIGSLQVPKKIGELLFSAFGAIVTTSAGDTLQNLGTLVNVEIEEGIIRFIMVPPNR